jgi:predicted RNase H-like HicB family nuclease
MTALPGTPVFNCVVHVAARDADGQVHARVVNLPRIEAHGRSEREALAQCVAAFKTAVAAATTTGQPIPWIDPLPRPGPGETERLIAVHL